MLWDWPPSLWPSKLEKLTSPPPCRRPSTTTCCLYLGCVCVLALSSSLAASLSNFRCLWKGPSTLRRHHRSPPLDLLCCLCWARRKNLPQPCRAHCQPGWHHHVYFYSFYKLNLCFIPIDTFQDWEEPDCTGGAKPPTPDASKYVYYLMNNYNLISALVIQKYCVLQYCAYYCWEAPQ